MDKDLFFGLIGWTLVFAISPLIAVALALVGFAFITWWGNQEEKVMEMYWNEHP